MMPQETRMPHRRPPAPARTEDAREREHREVISDSENLFRAYAESVKGTGQRELEQDLRACDQKQGR
jgi:hypothetical protein